MVNSVVEKKNRAVVQVVSRPQVWMIWGIEVEKSWQP